MNFGGVNETNTETTLTMTHHVRTNDQHHLLNIPMRPSYETHVLYLLWCKVNNPVVDLEVRLSGGTPVQIVPEELAQTLSGQVNAGMVSPYNA